MVDIDFDQIKRDYLLDTIRRVIANPSNAKEVAYKLAEDWFPVIHVDPQGRFEIMRAE